jgi:vitamin K-dependent gamma-carboxylase
MSFLFRPVDIASLVFFRIIFGLLAFIDLLGNYVYYHLTKGAYHPEAFRFHYYGFEWVEPLPEPFMSIALILFSLAALGMMAGKWYRLSAFLCFIGFNYTFLLEKAHYLNHGYLLCFMSFILIFLPAGRAFSLDVRKSPSIRMEKIPAWSVFILPFLMGLVYFYGGIAKLNSDWLQGIPLIFWLKTKSDMPLLGPIWSSEITAYLMSYGGLVLDLLVPFFLLSRKTRVPAFLFALFFHLTNTLLFNIGIFPWMSLTLTALFFPPDFPRRMIQTIGNKLSFLLRWRDRWNARVDSYPPVAPQEAGIGHPKNWRWISMILILGLAFHTTYPFRHHLLEGDVAWTEEGHRYSWRMMLRYKEGYGRFNVVLPETDEKININPRDSLTPRQNRKLLTHPDMVLEYAHHLRDQWQKKGYEKVEVYADIRANLNRRGTQRYIYPDVDLAKEEWDFFKESDWIIPYGQNEERE